jgi:hypothetical protein
MKAFWIIVAALTVGLFGLPCYAQDDPAQMIDDVDKDLRENDRQQDEPAQMIDDVDKDLRENDRQRDEPAQMIDDVDRDLRENDRQRDEPAQMIDNVDREINGETPPKSDQDEIPIPESNRNEQAIDNKLESMQDEDIEQMNVLEEDPDASEQLGTPQSQEEGP